MNDQPVPIQAFEIPPQAEVSTSAASGADVQPIIAVPNEAVVPTFGPEANLIKALANMGHQVVDIRAQAIQISYDQQPRRAA